MRAKLSLKWISRSWLIGSCVCFPCNVLTLLTTSISNEQLRVCFLYSPDSLLLFFCGSHKIIELLNSEGGSCFSQNCFWVNQVSSLPELLTKSWTKIPKEECGSAEDVGCWALKKKNWLQQKSSGQHFPGTGSWAVAFKCQIRASCLFPQDEVQFCSMKPSTESQQGEVGRSCIWILFSNAGS